MSKFANSHLVIDEHTRTIETITIIVRIEGKRMKLISSYKRHPPLKSNVL
jgi:hypothetical protein